MKTETPRETAERLSQFSLVAFHDNPDAVRAQLTHEIEHALRNVSNRVCDECASDIADGSGYCKTCDSFTMPSDFYLRWVRRTQMDEAIHAERERAAKIVNDARFENGVDLRELVSRIRGTNAD